MPTVRSLQSVDQLVGGGYSSESMLSASVCCTAKYKIGLSELMDIEEALKGWVINDCNFSLRVVHKVVDWVKKLLDRLQQGGGIGFGRHARSLT